MASMSYCRFENTSTDLARCVDDLREAHETGSLQEFINSRSSSHEKRAVRHLIQLAQELVELVESMDDNDGDEED